jgi:hypothetical protein
MIGEAFNNQQGKEGAVSGDNDGNGGGGENDDGDCDSGDATT